MVNYQKMYATLVGRVDNILTAMEKMKGTRGELLLVRIALFRALEEGEDAFIRDAEEEDLRDDADLDFLETL